MSHQGLNVEASFQGTVSPAFPLALLESIRSHDHPGEILEDEDLAVSLPRRLGLTGVVENQIARYENDRRSGRAVRIDEVLGLMRLVLRRPDAEPILVETGQRLTRFMFRRVPAVWSALLHRAPNVLGMRSARRSTARALRALRVGRRVDVQRPFTVRITGSATAALADRDYPGGCALITGLLEEQLLLSTGQAKRVVHESCSARGADDCVWSTS